MEKLTTLGIKAISEPGLYHDGGGLYLQATQWKDCGIAKSWLYRFVLADHEHRMGLGAYDDVPLADARKARDRERALVRDGINPIEARAAKKAAARIEAAKSVTFDAFAKLYIETHAPAWRGARHRQQWTNILRDYASPVFGALPIAAINTALVMKAVEPIWIDKPETARRLLQKLTKILDAARVRELRGGENPARWTGHLDQLLPSHSKTHRVQHHPALPFPELPPFMTRLATQECLAARALIYTVATCARSGETLGACWHEIDLEARVWTVSGDRMKSDRPHRVPLSDAAIAALGEPGKPNDRIFPLSTMAMPMLLRRMGVDATVHGFRSTFRDWAGDMTAFQREIIEAALAHSIGDKAEQAYRRGDALAKRAELMDAWAAFCMKEQHEKP